MLRLPQCVDSQLTDGSEVSLTHKPPFTPENRKLPGACFCLRLSRAQGHSAAERIRPSEKSMYAASCPLKVQKSYDVVCKVCCFITVNARNMK
jgi:hypothetical protein